MLNLRQLSGILTLLCLLSASVNTVSANQESITPETSSEIIPPAPDKADIAWVLVCSALVLMMTAPGLALFYGAVSYTHLTLPTNREV